MPTKKFSIIIPSCNEGDWLQKTVFWVLENTNYPDFEIIVVADGCSDNSIDFLKETSVPNVRYIEFSESLGSAKARNQGGKLADGEFLVFIDSHMKPLQENWLEVLAKQLEKEKIGAVTLKIPHLEEPDRVAYIYTLQDLALEPTWVSPLNKEEMQIVPAIPGACFAIRKNLFDATNGFDSGIRKWGREDLEYSLRLWRLGYDLVMCPDSALAHSWERKRKFDISWEEVDYNIFRTVLTLFSPEWAQKVIDHLQNIRPQNVKIAFQSLTKDVSFQKRKAELQNKFSRSFEDWCETFKEVLPVMKNE